MAFTVNTVLILPAALPGHPRPTGSQFSSLPALHNSYRYIRAHRSPPLLFTHPWFNYSVVELFHIGFRMPASPLLTNLRKIAYNMHSGRETWIIKTPL